MTISNQRIKHNKQMRVESLHLAKLVNTEQHYLIPMYQRNYTWGKAEIQQLILDIVDAFKKEKQLNYYLGTLVVFERDDGRLEVIDGQQRLTTLTFLVIYLSKSKTLDCTEYLNDFTQPNLDFESRPQSKRTLQLLIANKPYEVRQYQDINESIIYGYEQLEKIMDKELNNAQRETNLRSFCAFLFKNVKISRVPVPEKTDLNHYFEVMNNRGEQLEKHEIIKARFLSVFEKNSSGNNELIQNLVDTVWQACANMDKYIQYCFKPDFRYEIFSKSLTNFEASSFQELYEKYEQCYSLNVNKGTQASDTGESNENSLTSLLAFNDILFGDNITITNPYKKNPLDNNDDDETYSSIVNFSSFLLYILNIMVKTNPNTQSTLGDEVISLDDKQLITHFDKHIFNLDDESLKYQLAKQFIYILLKTKFLFDQYIIKRNNQKKGHWTLEKLYNNYNEDKSNQNNIYTIKSFEEILNEPLVMLQSAFHVSIPTMNYKYWLSSALLYLFKTFNKSHDSLNDNYLEYLNGLARSYMLEQYLSVTPSGLRLVVDAYNRDFFESKDMIVALESTKANTKILSIHKYQLLERINYQHVRSFVFNYLDYLIWNNCHVASTTKNKFKFTTQGSIEHFHPQNPINKVSETQSDFEVHRFGNLCLIDSRLNSKVSNNMPIAKKEHYDLAFAIKVDSLKLYKMIETFKAEGNKWGKESVFKHETEMLKLFESALNINIEGLEKNE